MSHKLVLEVPEEVYKPLTQIAQEAGKTPEALAVEWLASVGSYAIRDPLEPLIGALHGGPTDVAERHDYYLGQALMDELRGEDRAGD